MKMSIDKAIRFTLLAPFVAGMVIYGGGKPGPGQRPSRFFFDDYLSDIGSYSTNDIVHVASVKSSLQIPDDTPMHVYAALMGTTNWTELLPSRTYADQPADWTLADATNYDYIVMLDWVPPAPVVTNDILTVNALAAKGSTPPGTTLHAVLPRVALVTPIEYLESTGTQWIDTGFKANTATTSFECSITLGGGLSLSGLFGSRNTPSMADISSCNVFIGSGGLLFMDWPAGKRRNVNFTPGDYVISCTRGEYTINGTTYTISARESIDQDYNFLICSFSDGIQGAYTPSKAKWRYARLYSNGVLVFDGQPVRVGTTGAMLDRVSGKPFFNAGTGSFLLGPDL